MDNIVLKGITWNHTRGYAPLVATAQRFQELNPHITIQWDKRTLQEFADYPIEALTEQFDLLIIDHPWVGCAAATNTVIDFIKYVPKSYLDNQTENSVGKSYESYCYESGLWALPIDAAAPFASYRKDLMPEPPNTWAGLLSLAKQGKVACPAIPIDLLMNFYSFAKALQYNIFSDNNFININDGIAVLEKMKTLYSFLDKKMFSLNPIGVSELMVNTDDYWYCPFAYGYSNYSRNGYANKLLTYTDVISIDNAKLETTIGGTGIAVAASSKYIEQSVNFATWVCSEIIQKTLYTQYGGQPAHLQAWNCKLNNQICNNFFNTCLPIMQNGYMRPRYNGYLHFQENAGNPLQQYLLGKNSDLETIEAMNQYYLESKQSKTALC